MSFRITPADVQDLLLDLRNQYVQHVFNGTALHSFLGTIVSALAGISSILSSQTCGTSWDLLRKTGILIFRALSQPAHFPATAPSGK